MTAVIRLTDGTMIKTEPNMNSDDVIGQLDRHTSYRPFRDANGKTYRVNPAHVVYVRDVGPAEEDDDY